MDGRVYEPTLTALVAAGEDGTLEVRSPSVGLWRGGPDVGEVVVPGQPLGEIEILGKRHRVVAPATAAGRVVTAHRSASRTAVDHGRVLLVLDPQAAGAVAGELASAAARGAVAGKVFPSPMSGRFWVRPGPDKPAFVAAGDTLAAGQTLCLLEVMKTFNRVVYGGAGLPETATVKAVLPKDGDDVEAGDPLLELE